MGVSVGTVILGLTVAALLQHLGGAVVLDLEAPPSTSGLVVDSEWVKSIDEPSTARWIERVASPEFEGRDAPSAGLHAAQDWVSGQLVSFGFTGLPDADAAWAEWGESERTTVGDPSRSMRRPFRSMAAYFGREPFEFPADTGCTLEIAGGPQRDGVAVELACPEDVVPLRGSSLAEPRYRGTAAAELQFAGYGIDNDKESYDDFQALKAAGHSVRGRIAVVLQGEPDRAAGRGGLFAGEEVTAEAAIWNKVDALAREGAVGAVILVEGVPRFRATRAQWIPPVADRPRGGIPTLVAGDAAATALLGRDVGALRSALRDQALADVIAGLPARGTVSISAETERRGAELHNVVGWMPGTDPEAGYVLLGAHLDHVGVGPRGRIALGADDNGSGVAAVLGAARALAGRSRSRGLAVAFFTGEEDGLVGAWALSGSLEKSLGLPAAVVNLDMIGVGPSDGTVALGLGEHPELAGPLGRAWASGATGLERIRDVRDPSFYTRSDHFAFHERGVPSLFLFEDWPHASRTYHTWMDTPATVSALKVMRTSRLAALVVQELAGG